MANKKEKVVYDYIEEFNKIDKAEEENIQIRILLSELLEKNPDNEALQEYAELVKKLDENTQISSDSKKNMFQSMEDADIDNLRGKVVEASLVRTYFKTELDKDKLKEDLGDEKYNSYIVQKAVKGHVNINIIKE